jgi:type IV pilus assembly protein PilM
LLGLLGKRRQTPLLGLDISSTTVKLLELSRTGDKYRVESYAVCSLPQDAVVEKAVNDVDGVASAIRSVVAQSRSKLKHVAAAVAGSAVITKLVDMPAGLSDDEMETQLTLEADQYIPYPLEEVSLDFEIQGPAAERDDMVEVLLAACRRETIDARVEAIEGADLTPKVMDVEAYAMERAYGLIREHLELSENSVVAIVDIGATMTTLSVLATAAPSIPGSSCSGASSSPTRSCAATACPSRRPVWRRSRAACRTITNRSCSIRSAMPWCSR